MKKAAFATLAIASCSIAFTGCASIVSGTSQTIAVHNGELRNASCVLENDKGRWFVPNTPATVMIKRSYHDLLVDCKKPGYLANSRRVPSKTRGLAFGNVFAGGVVGLGVDMADGAAYDYPTDIYLPLHKKTQA